MSDIELVIKIPNHLYKLLKEFPSDSNEGNIENVLMKAVEHGTPLPKGHGDLIDRNEIEYMKAIHDLVWDEITSSECATKIKYSAPTIIEADRSVEDGNDD